jgi:outer membrane protein assembly factor BamB
VLIALAGATSAQAQYVDSVWPGFRGTAAKRGSVLADGPAVNHDFTIGNQGIVSAGGICVDDDGDIYFKTYDQEETQSFVRRLDGCTGANLASSPALVSAAGNYSGVSIGVDAIYASNYAGAGNTSIFKLNKNTLAVIDEFTDPAFVGLRGAPLISDIPNDAGNQVLYVADRNGVAIHAVDSVTGEVMWSHPVFADAPFMQLGPMWETGDGRQAFAYFANIDIGGGIAIADNGDGTFEVLWDFVGPDSFNWWGTGALSEDGERIYVPTFNDNDADSFWVIDVDDGSVIDSFSGQTEDGPLNFFGRPAVIGNRIYCGGGDGVVACFQDDGNGNISLVWTYRDNVDEHTAISAVRTPGGETYIYTARQNVPALLVLQDLGNTHDKLLETNLNGAMKATLFANNSCTVDADGSLWVGGGSPNEPDITPGDVYKFTIDGFECGGDCIADCNNDGSLNILDFVCFQGEWQDQTAQGDCDDNGLYNILDFVCYQGVFLDGCP